MLTTYFWSKRVDILGQKFGISHQICKLGIHFTPVDTKYRNEIMRPANNDKQRRHRTATSAAMKRMAAARKCPKCNRKSALKKLYIEGVGLLITCRWHDCNFERLVTVQHIDGT